MNKVDWVWLGIGFVSMFNQYFPGKFQAIVAALGYGAFGYFAGRTWGLSASENKHVDSNAKN